MKIIIITRAAGISLVKIGPFSHFWNAGRIKGMIIRGVWFIGGAITQYVKNFC